MADVDYKALAFYFHVFEISCIVAIAVYTWLVNRHKANAKAITDLGGAKDKKINSLDDRIIKAEKNIEHLPKQRDIAAIHRRIDECAQEVKKLDGTLEQVNNSVKMIYQHLLNS